MKGGAATKSSEARLKGSEKLKIRRFNHLRGCPADVSGKEPLHQCRRRKRQGFNP